MIRTILSYDSRALTIEQPRSEKIRLRWSEAEALAEFILDHRKTRKSCKSSPLSRDAFSSHNTKGQKIAPSRPCAKRAGSKFQNGSLLPCLRRLRQEQGIGLRKDSSVDCPHLDAKTIIKNGKRKQAGGAK